MYLNYEAFINDAMYNVIRKALYTILKEGLKDEHHFFISFVTFHPMVQLPERLRAKYPEEMTIVLEYELENFEVFHDYFSITLSFDGISTTLVVPIKAITSFFDPKANFKLILKVDETEFKAEKPILQTENIISLDSFRNKKK